MSIQRYLPTTNGTSFTGMKPAVEGGDYVLFTDHAAEVERLTAERDAAVARAEKAEKAEEALKPLVHFVRRIATPLDCGCRPCRGDCTSRDALLYHIEETMEEARGILDKINPPIPESTTCTFYKPGDDIAAPQPITVQAAPSDRERVNTDITTARLLLRSVWRSLDDAGRSMGRSLDAVALETAMELIDRNFKTSFAKAQLYDESPVDFIETARAALAAEPWDGPEGEEP